MQANLNGPVHDHVTSTAMADLPPYTTKDQGRVSPIQADNQARPQADFIHDIQPVRNDHPQEEFQTAPLVGADAILSIPDQKYVIPLDRLPDEPAPIDCPFCHKMTQTKVEKKDSSTTHIYGLLCCLFCGIICVCIPYLCHWAQETDYSCSQCGNRVAFRPHEGPMQVFGPQGVQQVPSKYAEAGRIDQATSGTNQAPLGEKAMRIQDQHV